MKLLAALILILALVVGIAPQFTDCQSQGKTIELPGGKPLPMKCHWTARAEIAVAAPLLACGLFLLFSRRKELWQQQAVLAVIIGLVVILLPTVLIGVCAKPDMVCHALMKPMLTLAGGFVMVLGAICYFLASRKKE